MLVRNEMPYYCLGLLHATNEPNNPLGLKIEQFGGTEGEIPKELLGKFDVFSSFQGWKEEKKASAFRLLLTGVADLWNKQLDDTTKPN